MAGQTEMFKAMAAAQRRKRVLVNNDKTTRLAALEHGGRAMELEDAGEGVGVDEDDMVEEEEEEGVVLRIVGERGEGAEMEYRVRWKGYKKADDSWEPLSSLLENASDKVLEYRAMIVAKRKKAEAGARERGGKKKKAVRGRRLSEPSPRKTRSRGMEARDDE
jgi:hypothetical protein